MFGLGKPRSRLGMFLDLSKITQDQLAKESGVSKSTISKLCMGEAYSPTLKNANRIIKALRKLTNVDVDYEDFWTV